MSDSLSEKLIYNDKRLHHIAHGDDLQDLQIVMQLLRQRKELVKRIFREDTSKEALTEFNLLLDHAGEQIKQVLWL